MRTTAPNYIATEQLLWLQPDGSRTRIVARIGLPYPVDDGTWACAAELQGVDPRYPDVCGASSMQALNLASALLATRLGHLLERGERLVDAEDASCAWDDEMLNSIFGLHGLRAPEPAR
jgi:hypothetical protein